MESIHHIVRSAETNYRTGSTKLGEYVDFSLYDTIERIIAYLNSKHTSGDKDSLGRDKPFFNIVTAAVNIWYRATDIDRKDIIIRADKGANIISAFLATVILQQWMNRERFGTFLNEWGRTLSAFGSAVSKFIVKDGELIPTVVPWSRMIVDPIDFDALPRIEKFYKTPSQLRKMKQLNQDTIDKLIASRSSRKTIQGTRKDNQDEFIELYEVHGELPLAFLKSVDDRKEKDWTTYRQQMHIISFVEKGRGEYDDFTLYSGKEKEDPYIKTDLIPEEGRTLAIGAVEYLFDAQWMQNHTIKNMKDTLDLSSKLIFQTADPRFTNKNVLSVMETGDILLHNPNQPLTELNNSKVDIAALQNFSNQWKVLSQELTSTPDSQRGINPPSGTPLGTTQILNQNSNSLFEIMTEHKGLGIEEMLRRFIIPFIKTKLDTKDEVVAVLDDHDIKKIDAMYIPKEAVRRYNLSAKEQILSGQIPSVFNQQESEQQITKELSLLGNIRPLFPKDITWKKVFENFEWEAEVGITNEPMDKQTMLTTLTSVLQSIASNPAILQDPNAKLVFNKILSFAGGVSPVELSLNQQPPTNPQGRSVVGVQ